MVLLQRLSPHQLQLPALAWALALLYSVGGGGLARGGELCPVTVTGNNTPCIDMVIPPSLCPDFWSPSHQFSVLATLILPLCLGPGTCTLIARSVQHSKHYLST